MSSQPRWEQIKATRISRSGLISLLAGIGIGLAVGLLIGWVLWPVEWQADPNAATVAKVEYLSLVADAYQGAGGAPGAVELAQTRLAQLETANAADFVAATEHYAAQPGSSDQVRNLVTLSIALGMPVDVASNPAVAQAMLPADAPALSGASSAGETQATGAQDADQSQPQEQGNGVNGFGLLLLIGLILAGCGAYVYYLVAKRRTAAQTETWSPAAGGFTDETDDDYVTVYNPVGGSSGGTITGYDRSTLQAAPAQPTAQPTPARTATTVAAASTFSPRNYSTVNTSPPVSGPPGFDPDEDFAAGAKTSTAYFARPVDEHDQAEPLALGDDETGEDDEYDEYDDATAEAVPAPKSAPPLRPPSPSRYERYKTIDTFSAAFHAGMANVDFVHNIKDEDGGRYLGEYGMFVHERNGLRNGNVDDVIAFEVTLVDKAAENPSLTTLARALISDYAHDNLYTQYENERQSGGGPIVAQQDTNFQLEGDQLLLDCTVTEVTYSKEGVFRSLTLDMVLKRK